MSASALFLIKPFGKVFPFNTWLQDMPTWPQLVETARWCPTIHNLQPHQLKIVSDTEATLFYDPKRLLPVGDPHAVFVTIAMSMFIEHLAIVANSYGYTIQVIGSIIPIDTKASESMPFARLKLVPTDKKDQLNSSLILERRTSRLHYNGMPLKQNSVDVIRAEAAKFNHEFFHSSDPEFVDFIIDLNQQTLFEDLESKPGREELHRLFRYSKEEAEAHKDGLWAKCMDFPGKLMKSVFTHHERWEKGARKKLLGNYYQSSFNGTETVCWFGGAFENTEDWLNAGKMFARTWLRMTEDGAYIHPFGSLITNKGAYQRINETLEQASGNKKIWMIFRAGYSKEPVRSYRLSTNEIILK